MPFFLWLRLLTGRKLQALHRHHLGAQARDAGRNCRSTTAPCPRRVLCRWRPSC
jgi:RNA polymerase sigma-70 factor (ECF subfamily)